MDILPTWHGMIMDAERIPFIIAAIIVVMIAGVVTGPLAGNANPFMWAVIDKLLGRSGDRTRTCVGRCRLRSLENWRQWKLGNEHQVGSCRAHLFGGGLGDSLWCWAQGLWLGRAAVLDDETGVGSRGYEGN